MNLEKVITTLRQDQIDYLKFITTMYNISRAQQIRILIDKAMKEDEAYELYQVD